MKRGWEATLECFVNNVYKSVLATKDDDECKATDAC